jgi:hypothetical protein
MPDLVIRLKKHSDGSAALTCIRADGSSTWQRQTGAHARFFPRHDLTHYAVETVLGHRRGFYGLVAEGWDIGDFGAPWPKGRIPDDADPSELIVGFLDAERAGQSRGASAADFNASGASYAASHGGGTFTRVALTDAELTRIRERMAELFAQWDAVPPGETLELHFDRTGA